MREMEKYIWDHRDPYQWMERVRTSSLPPLVICAAITGGVQGKEANENLPETPEEQVEQTRDAYLAGASMVHVHARDPEHWYNSSGDAERYRLVNGMIREKCPDIILNNTTGGTWGMSMQERLCVLDANPEVVSLNLGPDMFKLTLKERTAPIAHPRAEVRLNDCVPCTYAELAEAARAIRERGIKPELEMYHPGMFWVVNDLIAEDVVESPCLVQFVMGYQTSSYPTPANLIALVNELPRQSVWEVSGIGAYQLPMTVMAVLMGAHMVRVGMEDNVYYSRGRKLRSNAEAVERIARIARDVNREIATPKQAREMLGLSPTPTQY